MTFQDQSHFPGLSRSWKFKEKNPGLSRIFQAWEPCLKQQQCKQDPCMGRAARGLGRS